MKILSLTQRYKALGNAFNVDVVAHILSFIKQTKTTTLTPPEQPYDKIEEIRDIDYMFDK